jgi:hypothetical protein
LEAACKNFQVPKYMHQNVPSVFGKKVKEKKGKKKKKCHQPYPKAVRRLKKKERKMQQ